MRKKEDIGELIAKQLGAAAVSANDSLWERIDVSLNRRKRRRRFLFFLMVPATAGLIYVSGAYNAIFNTKSEVRVQSEISELPPNPLVENTLVFDDSLLAPEGYTYPKDSTPNQLYVDPEPLHLQPVIDPIDEDSIRTKKTTYYYYNNRNKVQFKSEDPKKIDSISTLNYKQLKIKNDSAAAPRLK